MKEKLGNYLLDVSKYLLTAGVIGAAIQDLANMRAVLYIAMFIVAIVTLIVGLIFTKKK